MCELREAKAAQNAAAEQLTAVCLSMCTDDIGMTVKSVWDSVLLERIPDDMRALIEKLK